MSESKHTPGPWRWSDDYSTSSGEKTWSLIGADGYGILSCDGFGNSPHGQGLIGEANARLITAAPELLEALKRAADSIEEWGGYADEYFQKKWDLAGDIAKARAAIAKAEGDKS